MDDYLVDTQKLHFDDLLHQMAGKSKERYRVPDTIVKAVPIRQSTDVKMYNFQPKKSLNGLSPR